MSQQPAEESPLLTPDPPEPPKKFRQWFLARWNSILLAYLGVLLVTVFVVVAVISGQDQEVDPFSLNDSGVAILGEVIEFDWLKTRRVSVRWLIVGRGEYALQGNSDRYPPVNRAVDVFLDDASNPAFSYDPTQLPMTGSGGRLTRWGSVSFYKEHEIAIGDQYRTPLDQYDFRAFAFVLEKGTTRNIPITMFAVSSTGPIDFTTPSFEEQTKTNFTYTTGDGPVTIEVESHTMSATIKHSNRARALTFSMFSINWVLTLCSVAIALIVLTRWGEVKDGVALLPITVILSLPSIRGIFVGSPPFGILLDVVGFFPQMLTVLVCSMIVLCIFAARPSQDRGTAPGKGEVQLHGISSAAA